MRLHYPAVSSSTGPTAQLFTDALESDIVCLLDNSGVIMESFDEVIRRARDQAEVKKRLEADRLRQANEASLGKERQAQNLSILLPTIKREAMMVAKALSGRLGVPEIYAIDSDDHFKARKMLPSGNPLHGAPAQWRVNRAERKAEDFKHAHSFKVWDTFARWEYTEPNEPWETHREHYLLNRSGDVFYADYVRGQHGHNPEDPVITRSFDLNTEHHETKLQTLRQGLGNLVATYNLQLG